MRLAAASLGARARRREGRPVDLARERRTNDRITKWLRVPDGVTLTDELVGGVPVVRLSSGGGSRGTVLYLHGGAYALGSARQGLNAVGLCRTGGPDLISVGYRLAPEHPWPAAVDDAVTVYRELVGSPGSDRLVAMGESAGGGLLLLLLQRARDEGLPMPAAAVAAFPWTDLSMSGQSSRDNVGKDMLTRSELVQEAAWFAGNRDARDPMVSPLFGSFRDFPRTYIAVGTNDLLLDDARRVAAAMAAEGVDVELDEWPGAIHGFTAMPFAEGKQYRRRLRAYVDAALPGHAEDPTNTPHICERVPPDRGRVRSGAVGYLLRAVKATPPSVRERVLDAASSGVSSNLPPFADVLRLVEAAGGVPDGTRWQTHLVTEKPSLQDVRIRDLSDDSNGRLRARLYLPAPGAPAATAALVWVHGGAFVIGSLDQKEAHWPAIELAASGIPVLSVDYRMCINGVHYPAPQDDVLTAWRWAVEHSDELGVDPAQLHIGGASAGGCLVAGAALRLRDDNGQLPASLFLAYPVLQGRLPAPTPTIAAELSTVGDVSDDWLRDMFANWAGNAPWDGPYVSPGLADPAGLPPTYILTCGQDHLRRASEPYADRLRHAGVPVWHDLFQESKHAPLDRPGTHDGQRAIERLRTWLAGGITAMG